MRFCSGKRRTWLQYRGVPGENWRHGAVAVSIATASELNGMLFCLSIMLDSAEIQSPRTSATYTLRYTSVSKFVENAHFRRNRYLIYNLSFIVFEAYIGDNGELYTLGDKFIANFVFGQILLFNFTFM